jgi:hypothetical protein
MIGFTGTSLKLQSIITAHNQWLLKTRSIPDWTTSVFSSPVTDLVLIYESVTSSASVVCWLTFHSWTLNLRINQSRMTALLRLNRSESDSESYVTTYGQSARLSWNKAPIWDLRPDFYYCQTVAGLLIYGRSLWRENEYVVYNCIWPSPALNRSSLHGFSYRLPVTMENVCCHGNVLTEPLTGNGLVRCYRKVCLASRCLAMDFRSGSAIPAFRYRVTLYIFRLWKIWV